MGNFLIEKESHFWNKTKKNRLSMPRWPTMAKRLLGLFTMESGEVSLMAGSTQNLMRKRGEAKLHLYSYNFEVDSMAVKMVLKSGLCLPITEIRLSLL